MGLNRVEATHVEVGVEKAAETPKSRVEATHAEVGVEAAAIIPKSRVEATHAEVAISAHALPSAGDWWWGQVGAP